jgi:arsenate reductase-like glutaredoxin family protein
MIDHTDLEYTKNRVKYYNEMPTKAEFLEMIEHWENEVERLEDDAQDTYDKGVEDTEELANERFVLIERAQRELESLDNLTRAKDIKEKLNEILAMIEREK